VHRISFDLSPKLIVKATVEAASYLSSQADDLDKLYKSVKGFVFFGVPHGGSEVYHKKRIKILKLIAQVAFKEVPPKLDRLLESGSNELLDLADSFRLLSSYVNNELVMMSFYENLATEKLGVRVSYSNVLVTITYNSLGC
jgi:hypothetical protein